MKETNAHLVERLNQLKHKLKKYYELKESDKVCTYLDSLAAVDITKDSLIQSDILALLREIRKKENPAFSMKAGDLISKWKKKLARELDPANEYEPTPIQQNLSKTSSHKQASVKRESSIKTSKSNNEEANKSINKKRTSSVSAEKLKNVEVDESSSQDSKKPKLSLSDYKSLKAPGDSGTGSNSSSQSDEPKPRIKKEFKDDDKYGLLSSLTDEFDDNYSPTPIQKPASKQSNHSKTNQVEKKSESSKNQLPVKKTDTSIEKQKIIVPPLPLAPLTKNLLSEPSKAKSEPYELVAPIALSRPLRGPPLRGSSFGTSTITFSATSGQTTSSNDYASILAAEDAALTAIMKQKQSKRMIYTGRKVDNGGALAQVPKLFDLSVRNLIENLDDLHMKISIYNMSHSWPMQFDVIKPALEKANAKQLENIEYYSPNILEDSDDLWKKLCEQEFKKLEPPEEDESWRELYFKKLDQRNEQFERARQLVSSMQKNKPKERQTQMATIKAAKYTGVRPYGGPKSYNGPRSGQKPESIPVASSSSMSNSNSAFPVRKIINNAAPVKLGGSNKIFARVPPVMSQGMRATMKMLKKTTRR